MKITQLIYAESEWTEEMMMNGGDPNKIYPLDFIIYLLEEKGRKILVDAGCDTMGPFVMRNFIGPVRALEKIGVSPEEISDVIVTHAHHDHIDGVRHFKKSLIHIQRDEYEMGKSYLKDDFRVNIFDDEYTVFESIKVKKIGGHTDGSCIVTFDMDGKKCVITGDECYKREALEQKRPRDNAASRTFFEEYSKPCYNVYFCHDRSSIISE